MSQLSLSRSATGEPSSPASLDDRRDGIAAPRSRVVYAPRPCRVEHTTAGRSFHTILRLGLRCRLAVRDLGPALRRTIDVIVATLGLIALCPVLVIAALAIRLSSRGPIFFWQERIGCQGQPFVMPKLRTMVENAEALKQELAARHEDAMDQGRFKLARDPRITPAGHVLRRYSIDEMPQLWSVLKGDMTLMGPRPPLESEVSLYNARSARRLEVTPGLTCLWQVRGRSDLSFEEQVELDIEYIDQVGVGDEVKIFLATIPAVLTGRGAY